MRGLVVIALSAAVLLGAWLPGQCAWLGLGADAGRTGYTKESPTLPMSTLWKFYYPDPENQTTPAVQGGRVYFVAKTWLFCLYQQDGSRKWEFDAKALIRSSPLLVGNYVIFGDDAGALRALDQASGAVKWQRLFQGAILAAPLFYQGKVFVGTADKQVVAVDPNTGEQVWSFTTDSLVSLPLAAGGNIVFALDRRNYIYALEAASGRLLWRGKSEQPLSLGPVVSQDVLFLVSGEFLYGMTLRGSKMWSIRSDRPLNYAPATAGDLIYMTGSDGRIYALTARGGAIRWVYADPEISITSSPTVAGGVLLAGGSSGAVLALDLATGKLLWHCQERSLTTPLDEPGRQSAASQPVFADGSLFLLSTDGNLSCFSPQAPDLTGPIITEIGPSGRRVVSGQLPLAIQARIFDEGSGLRPGTIEIYFDGEKAKMVKEPLSGAYYYIINGKKPKDAVEDGPHTVTIVASDYRGNMTTVAWKFTTDKSIVTPARLISPELAAQLRMGKGGGASRTAAGAGRGAGFGGGAGRR